MEDLSWLWVERCADEACQRDAVLLTLEMEEGAMSQGMQWPPEYGNSQEMDSALESAAGRQSC